jgi:hypothetical protein
MLFYSTTDQMSLNAFHFSARASTSSPKRAVPSLAVRANLACMLFSRLVMVSPVLIYHVTLRLIRERQALTLVFRFDMAGRAGWLDSGDMAMDWDERNLPDLVDACTAGHGYEGCLGFSIQVVGRSGKSWPGSIGPGTGVFYGAGFLDCDDLPVGRSV